MELYIAQDSQAQGSGWWRWSVWLDGAPEALNQVNTVDYILHPTFREPVQQVTNRNSNFRLDASGWGEFLIRANVHLHDGSTQRLEQWLHLDADEQGAAPTKGGFVPASLESFQPDTAFVKGPPIGRGSVAASTILFLSHSIVDQPLADRVATLLTDHALTPIMAEDLDANLLLDEAFKAAVGRVDGGVFLITEVSSPWMLAELAALPGNTPAVPVLIGPRARLPKQLAAVEPVHISEHQDVNITAQAIVDALLRRFQSGRR
ncbi:MAG TPA: hypothetical protein P5121_34415 [Caldilineaceae bacterium]|nr:hypothetical protein [Caldilineaceae bacterium]